MAQNLQNAAYTKEYRVYRAKFEKLFVDALKTTSETIILTDGYKIEQTSYEGKIEECNLHGSSSILIDNDDNILHRWNNLDDNADFHTIIEHQDGRKYLIYREDLYGYSVYDLTHNRTFEYYPQCVLDGKEYFIWTEVFYNRENNLLAVSGCIWGAPWSILLLDFEDPMKEPRFQKDIIDLLEGGYDNYDDATFISWDNQSLNVECYNWVKKEKEKIVLKDIRKHITQSI